MTTPPEQPPASEPVPPYSWPTGRGVPETPAPPSAPPPAAPTYGTPTYGTPAPGTTPPPYSPSPVTPPAYGAPENGQWPDHPQHPPVPQQRGGSVGRGLRRGGGAAVAGTAGLAKLGVLAKFFAVFKLLFVAAKLKFALSLIVSVALYTAFWGWKFAVGFVLLMLLHELGHVLELRRQGIPTTAVMFVPFLGAYTAHEERARTPRDAATIAFAGPLLGTVAATSLYYLGQVSQSQLFVALAYTGFLLNLFNLLPLPPFDGGRVAAAIHPAIWLVGVGVGGWYVFSHRFNPLLFVILLIGIWKVVGYLRRPHEHTDHLAVPQQERLAIGAAYATLALWCVWGMHVAFVVLPG